MTGRDPDIVLTELLVLGVQAGDTRDLARLHRLWAPRLMRHAARLAEADDVADVCQEAWLAIARGIRLLDDPASFVAWAYRIVSHKASDSVRSRRRHRRMPIDAAKRLPDGSTPDLDPVRQALREMPIEKRAILAMHHVDGLGIAQIALALAIPAGTVKSRLHAAREDLKRRVEGVTS
jgi:RNA polymerase sigma-70 factor (ECF subfamily)